MSTSWTARSKTSVGRGEIIKNSLEPLDSRLREDEDDRRGERGRGRPPLFSSIISTVIRRDRRGPSFYRVCEGQEESGRRGPFFFFFLDSPIVMLGRRGR